LFVEVGPGQVLTGLLKKISRQTQSVNFQSEVEPEKVIARLKEAV
jgi:[acyl-carrier-protein] S-malonyltransferase